MPGASPSALLDYLADVNDHLFYDLPPQGPRFAPRLVINAFKGGMLPFCLLLMAITGNTSRRALVYTGLHGSYGLVWLLKDLIFGDKSFAKPATLASNAVIALGLSLYQLIAYLAITRSRNQQPA